jgi:hypothetical protein
MITAMTELLVFWVLVLVVAGALAALRDIHDDGYGHRPPPSSHHADLSDPDLYLSHGSTPVPPRWSRH